MSSPRRRVSLIWYVLALTTGVAAAASAVTGTWMYFDFTNAIGGRVEAQLTRQLQTTVEDTAKHLDGAKLEQLYDARDTTSADYAELQAVLRAMQKTHGLSTDIYTLHRDNNQTRFGLTAKDTPLMGEVYELKAEMLPVFAGADTGQTGVYEDDHGWWISAYAPVRGPGDEVVGIVEADFDLLPFVRDTRERTTRSVLLALAVVVVLGFPIYLFMGWRLVRPLKELAAQAEKISQGEVSDVQPNRQAAGEVGLLAESFERAVVAIRYYMQRLRELESGDDDTGSIDGGYDDAEQT